MTLLDRYIARAILPVVLVCLAALLSLSLFVDFAQQSRFAGQGQYTLLDGLAYAALRIPQFAFEALPAAAIIGSFLALGNLSAHHELTVARASGVSVLRLSAPVWTTGAVLVLLAFFLGDSLAPPMHALGKRMRAAAMIPTPALAHGEGVWMRDGDLILNLRPGGQQEGYASAILFRLGADGISAWGRARTARINEDGRLELGGYEETAIEERRTRVQSRDEWVMETRLSPTGRQRPGRSRLGHRAGVVSRQPRRGGGRPTLRRRALAGCLDTHAGPRRGRFATAAPRRPPPLAPPIVRADRHRRHQ